MNIIKKCFTLLLLSGLFLNINTMKADAQTKEFDLLIAGGRIIDGTGNPWFYGDVAIKNGRIVEIGRIDGKRASRVIDARGKVVAPGFIDVHGHLEGGIEKMPLAENYLQMGVTSVITGNCGFSESPLKEWFAGLEKKGISINVGSLAGHNVIRRQGMNGDFDRPPTVKELQKMRDLTAQAMRDGAFGFSTGLEYVPGIYAKTDEIVALAKESAGLGGIYTTHMRDEGIAVEQAIKESLKVGELASCPVEISHFKISAKNRWGASDTTIKLIEEARRNGQQVTVDQYLYTAGATGIDYIFPAWLFDGGAEKVKERLNDPETRTRVKKEILEKVAGQGFDDLSFVQISSYAPNPAFNGKRLNEIAEMVKKDASAEAQAELAVEIKLNGGAGVVVHKMSESDVERIFRQPFTMVAADADVIELVGESSPHPRVFGNNARVLALYTRDKKLVGLEEAIRKMTSLPAQTFGLWDRGILRPGMAADIVVFDFATVADKATFEKPKQYPVGFDYVIVNGRITVEKGKHNGTKAGQILRGRGI
ncbi:amidohydrolase family protein [soil metagenome]